MHSTSDGLKKVLSGNEKYQATLQHIRTPRGAVLFPFGLSKKVPKDSTIYGLKKVLTGNTKYQATLQHTAILFDVPFRSR